MRGMPCKGESKGETKGQSKAESKAESEAESKAESKGEYSPTRDLKPVFAPAAQRRANI